MTEKYVDWSKAPEGATHVYAPCVREDGKLTVGGAWEKWEDGGVYAWYGYWCPVGTPETLANNNQRIKRPEENNKMIERDKTYTLELTGLQIGLLYLLLRSYKANYAVSEIYNKVSSVLDSNFKPSHTPNLGSIDLYSDRYNIAKYMKELFTPPKTKEQEAAEKQQQEYDKLMSQISELQTQAEKMKPKGV